MTNEKAMVDPKRIALQKRLSHELSSMHMQMYMVENYIHPFHCDAKDFPRRKNILRHLDNISNTAKEMIDDLKAYDERRKAS